MPDVSNYVLKPPNYVANASSFQYSRGYLAMTLDPEIIARQRRNTTGS